jgi:hypothetical protein
MPANGPRSFALRAYGDRFRSTMMALHSVRYRALRPFAAYRARVLQRLGRSSQTGACHPPKS